MFKLMKYVVCMVMMLTVVGIAQADVVYFWGNASGDWSDLAVWGGSATLPSPTSTNQDIAIVIGGVTIEVTTDGMGAIDLMGGYHVGYNVIKVAAGKHLQIVHLAQIGCGGDGDENIATGELKVYGSFYCEQLALAQLSQDDSGIINIYDGGVMNVGYWGCAIGSNGTGTGTLNIKGGNFWTASPITINAQGLVNIGAGTLRVLGDNVTQIQNYINTGKIIGYNGIGSVNTPVMEGDWTVVTASEPPQTLMTLGKGIVIDRQFHEIPVPTNIQVSAADVELIKLMGFDFAKVIVNPALMISGSTINTANMWYIDDLVNKFADRGVPVVLCIHPEPTFKQYYLGSGGANFPALLGFYQDFAAYLAARWGRGELAFELMTEPFGNYTTWNTMLPQMWQAARSGMPDNLLILNSDNVASIDQLIQLTPVNDPNVYYGFTTYSPTIFTFQGAYFAGSYFPALQRVPYPSSPTIIAAEKSRILNFLWAEGYDTAQADADLTAYGNANWNKSKQLAMLAPVVAWNNANGGNLKVICSEFGVLDPNQAKKVTGIDAGCDPDDRTQFIKDRREAFEESNIAWAYWSYNDTFTVLNPAVREPLVPAPPVTWVHNPTLEALGLPVLGCGTIVMPSSPVDFNGDCKVNMLDFPVFAETWLECTEPTDAACN